MGFDWAYRSGTPPWDIGRPQPAFVELAEAGSIAAPVLDVGCGTGENALYLASRGLEVLGIDASPTAIDRAREKAAEREVEATFEVRDALALGVLGRTFSTAIDSGLFHVFSDAERPLFVRGLQSVLVPGARYFVLCFSDLEPPGWGPRRVSQDEIRAAFAEGWRVDSIVATRFAIVGPDQGPAAWLASLTRI